MLVKVVVDTNVFVSVLLSPEGSARQILRLCLLGQLAPLMGNALFAEYEDVIGRQNLFLKALANPDERNDLLDAFAAC